MSASRLSAIGQSFPGDAGQLISCDRKRKQRRRATYLMSSCPRYCRVIMDSQTFV